MAGRASFTRRAFLGAAATTTAELALHGSPAAAAAVQPAGGAASIVGSTLVVNVRATAAARVRARAWPRSAPTQVLTSGWQATNRSHAANIVVTGASPVHRDWVWQGEVQDALGTSAPIGDIARTVPAWPARGERSAFAFGFGACITHALPAPAMTHSHSWEPKFFAIIGDMDYVDWGSTPQTYELYSKWFTYFLTRNEVAPLVAGHPIMGVQDDHDYGLDGCSAATIKTYAAQAYADVIPGAQYPQATYRQWGLGDVDVWLLDNRRYKDPKGGPYENGQWMSVLRSAQRSWLLNGLAASPARLKIILAPMTFGYYWSKGEQAVVKDWISAHVSGTVIFCTGDRHQTAFVHPAPRIWEFLACPINNPKKTVAYSIPGLVWVEHPGATATSNAVGVMEIDTATASPYVTMRAVTDNGGTLHAETVRI